MNHKIIEILDTFKYSCNIKSDYLDESRVNAFLPNYQLVEYLKNTITDITSNNSTKSILVSGAYGTGKSYLISILSAILSKNDLNLDPLKKKIDNYINSEEFISKHIQTSNYLIVFPQDIFRHFKQAITQGIVNTAKENNLNLKFNYIFDVIITKIQQWKNEFPYFYELLENIETDVPRLIERLHNHDDQALEKFINIYPQIMAGDKLSLISEKVSFIDNLREFENSIKVLGYKGVIYVFDEFGRYLESNANFLDVKEVQDMAEFCNRTGSCSSFILSTHKGLFQYGNSDTNHNDQIEWEKVSGRFKQIHLSNDADNIGNIVKTIIFKTKYYNEFITTYSSDYDRYVDDFYELQTTEETTILDDLFPLNYLSGKILPLITTKLGQNDRTLYTFLCSDQKGSLRDEFVKLTGGFKTVTPDKIYDYFASNFENLDLRSSEYKIYNISQNHLRSTKISKEKKLIKTLALLSIVDTSYDLDSTKEVLKIASGLDNETFVKTIESLLNKRILIYRRHTELYELTTDLTYNIDKDVEDNLNKITMSNNELREILLEVITSNYLYPHYYNQKYQINRYLHVYHIFDFDYSNFLSSNIIDENSDYNIIYLIRTNKNIHLDYSEIKNALLVTNSKSTLDILPILKELYSIENVATYPNYKDNHNALIELDRYKFESINKVKNSINNYFDFNNSIYIYPERKRIKSKDDFHTLLMDHLIKKYPLYKRLNYEVINMSKLSIPVKTARGRIIDKIFNQQFDKGYFQNTGAENSIARIVLHKTDLIDDFGKICCEKSYFRDLFNDLKNDISKGLKEFDLLYKKYTTMDGLYGYRKGVFSLLIAVFMKFYEKNIYITQREGIIAEEMEINPDLINQIEDSPHKYEIYFYEFDKSVDTFFEGIRSFLISYTDDGLYNHDPSKASIKALVQFLYDRSDLMYSTDGFNYESKHDIIQFIEKVSERTPKQFWFKIMPEFLIENNLLYLREKITDRLQELLDGEHSLIEGLKSIVFDVLNENIKEHEVDENNVIDILINYNYKNDHINDVLRDKLTNKDTWLQNFTEYLMGFSYKKWVHISYMNDFRSKLQKLFKSTDNDNLVINKSRNNGLVKVLKSKINSQLINFGTALSKEEKIEILKQLIREIK